MKNTIKNEYSKRLRMAAAATVWVCCASATCAVWAAPATGGFAYRATIAAQPDATWIRLQLPPAALAQVQTADAQDVQVQDAQGLALPLYVAPMAQVVPAAAQFSVSYPALPYTLAQPAATAGEKLQLRVQSAGQSIAIDSSNMGAAGATEQAVLLDLRGEKARWQAVVLDADLPPNQAVQLQLASSRDMQHWQPLTADGVVYRFAPQAGAPALENMRLRLPSAWQAQGQYLRISWAADSGAVQLRGLRGELAQAHPAPQWARIPLGLAQVQNADGLQWQLPFALPVQGLQAHWPEQEQASGSAVVYWPYRLEARKTAAAPWQTQGRGLLWRSPVAQGMDIDLSGNWQALRLHALPPAAQNAGAAAMQLTALVAPIELVALAAQGQPPYTLVVGRKAQRGDTLHAAPRLPQEQLLKMGLKDWRSLPIASLGAAQITPVPQGWWAQTQAAWQQDRRPFVLWAILLGGVLLLAGLAWRLARGMRAAPRGKAS